MTNGENVCNDSSTRDEPATYMKIACDVIFTQMTANAGSKKFGAPAVATMVKEFTQLNGGAVPGEHVVVPIDLSTLTAMENLKSLPAVNLIKEKWDGAITGRSCVDGNN